MTTTDAILATVPPLIATGVVLGTARSFGFTSGPRRRRSRQRRRL